MILITEKLCSGLSSRFVKLNVVVLLHESKSPIFNRPVEKRFLLKTDFCKEKHTMKIFARFHNNFLPLTMPRLSTEKIAFNLKLLNPGVK